MARLILSMAMVLACAAGAEAGIRVYHGGRMSSSPPVYVHPHYNSGSYVQPYYRTAPNAYRMDNWSTYPNVNPYTGRQGTRHYYGW
jgi:hypothetical protein